MLLPDGSVAPRGFTVVDGRVGAMTREAPALEVLDFGDALVVPGAIDAHVHFRDPGNPEKEDFGSGTRGAAQGGVTTVLDMPNTRPPVLTYDALVQKREAARAKACVDFGLYAGLDAQGEATALLPDVAAMKIYLGSSTGNLLVRDLGVVRRALEAAAAAGRTVAVHCESEGCLERHAHLNDGSYPAHAASRPAVCEAEAIRDLARAAQGTGARVHVAHLSTKAGLEVLAGTGFSAEVAPHHLLFTADRLLDGGAFKMNPPLRHAHDLEALWAALADGRIAALASDHAPHTPSEKATPRASECPSGVPGVETLVPLLLPFALAGRLSLARLVDASTASARIFALPGKGALAPGMDADFAVYDLARETRVEAGRLASRAGWTPFEGMSAIFPTHVAVRGEAVVREGRFVGRGGGGREVRPEPLSKA